VAQGLGVWCSLEATIEMDNNLWARWCRDFGGLSSEAKFKCRDSRLSNFKMFLYQVVNKAR
jgi:hypothetical protein